MSDQLDEFLAHYGKKGMKWGQRNRESSQVLAYKKQQAANTTVRQSLTRTNGVTGLDVIKNRGNVRKAVASRNQKNVDTIERVQKGQASTVDILKVYGSISVHDVYKSRR